MLQIASFGSCLSRYTANNYIKLFGGELLSSVYHNRSDSFYNKFINPIWQEGNYFSISQSLITDGEYDPDTLPENILKNQFLPTIGQHRLKKGIPFLELLESNVLDLIIMDNYMDLAAKLISSDSFDGLFLQLRSLSFNDNKFDVLDLLSPEKGALYMAEIVTFFKKKSPGAKIVFLNFPYNTYKDDEKRIIRSIEYQQRFKYEGIHIIPALDICESFQTNEKQHYKPQQYCAYAGLIKSLIFPY